MPKITGLTKLADGMEKAVRQAPGKYQDLQKKVALRYFVHLDQNAPPDDEGRLRKSLHRQPYKGEQEWVEEYSGYDVEVGSKVYYATMVNDGHVIGKRSKGHNHGSRNGKRRAKGGYEVNKGFVPGTHFLERALKDLDPELKGMAEDFMADVLKEVAD